MKPGKSDSQTAAGDKAGPGARDLSTICLAPLPPSPAAWPLQGKAEILAAVRRGSISLSHAYQVYKLSTEQFLVWQRGEGLYGQTGLCAAAALQKQRRNAAAAYQLAENPLPPAGDPAPTESN